uniref:Gag-pol polyprotein n=1 Tax=Haemonchus contortus TaxID=6289 RepID=W6NFE6_HAECO
MIRRRYKCLRITCPPLTQDNVPFRDYANTIKRMDEDAALKEMGYTSMKTLQFVAGLQDPSLREIRLRMLRRLDTQAEDAPLTIEDLVAECENITALKVDNANMEGSHDVHAVQKNNVKCFKCGGPHYKTFCPLLMKQSPKKPKRMQHRHKRNKCKNVATFSTEHARTYISVDVRGHKLRFQLDTGADITLISRHTWKKLGFIALEPYATPVKTSDGSPMKIDGRFHTEFSVKDRTNGEQHHGNGYCYVTESTNLLGLEWCTQLPAYKERVAGEVSLPNGVGFGSYQEFLSGRSDETVRSGFKERARSMQESKGEVIPQRGRNIGFQKETTSPFCFHS